MDFTEGYRLKVGALEELAKLMTAYRTGAIRHLASVYARSVAGRAVESYDRSRLGIAPHRPDFLADALQSVVGENDRTVDGVYAPDLNCSISFFFVGSALLATMEHGSERQRKAWESRREVVRWGWWADRPKPAHVGEAAWIERGRYWGEAERIAASGMGTMRFELLERQLPPIGWAAVQKFLPSFESRVESAVRALAKAEGLNPEKLAERDEMRIEDRVRKALPPEVTRGRLQSDKAQPGPPARPARSHGPQRKPDPAKPSDDRAAQIDHADVVVASDGRPFVAVPYVGFSAEERITLQVGSREIVFLQNGVIFGTLANVSASVRDYLRTLTAIVVVEVATKGDKRLLRAKHTAMVSDISLGEGFRPTVKTFSKRPRDAGVEEI